MFANLKTKDFALEATQLTDPDKLCTLLALLAFAVGLAVKTGITMVRLHPIPVKNTAAELGRCSLSACTRSAKSSSPHVPDQIIAFLGQLLSPKLPIKPLRFLAFR